MRCIEGGFQWSICLLDANPNDWRKCWSKLIFRIIVQQHFWRKYSFQGVPERWGCNAKVPSVRWEGGKGFGHFLELHNEVLNTMLTGSTTPSLPSPHAVFAQLSSLSWSLESATRETKYILSHDCTDLKLSKNLPKKGRTITNMSLTIRWKLMVETPAQIVWAPRTIFSVLLFVSLKIK